MNIEYLYHILLSFNLQIYRYNVKTGKVNFIDSQKETLNILQLFQNNQQFHHTICYFNWGIH